jgi:hypothetical protein
MYRIVTSVQTKIGISSDGNLSALSNSLGLIWGGKDVNHPKKKKMGKIFQVHVLVWISMLDEESNCKWAFLHIQNKSAYFVREWKKILDLHRRKTKFSFLLPSKSNNHM